MNTPIREVGREAGGTAEIPWAEIVGRLLSLQATMQAAADADTLVRLLAAECAALPGVARIAVHAPGRAPEDYSHPGRARAATAGADRPGPGTAPVYRTEHRFTIGGGSGAMDLLVEDDGSGHLPPLLPLLGQAVRMAATLVEGRQAVASVAAATAATAGGAPRDGHRASGTGPAGPTGVDPRAFVDFPGCLFRLSLPPDLLLTFEAGPVERITGLPPSFFAQGESLALEDLVVPDDYLFLGEVIARRLGERAPFDGECRIRHASGEARWIEIWGQGSYNADGTLAGIHGAFFDITQRKGEEEQGRYLSYHDPLTGLPNRRLFLDRLGQEVRFAGRKKEILGILVLNLENFRELNARYGTEVGDRLLQEVAMRIKGALRDGDSVARIGGDEFAILLASLGEPLQIEPVADRLSDMLAAPSAVLREKEELTTTVGIAVFPVDGAEPEILLQKADRAMFAAKDGGRGGRRFYTQGLQAEADERAQLYRELRLAVARGEFELRYQPVVGIPGLRVEGTEAYIRWQHPERGLLPPARFLRAADDLGLMPEIGDLAFRMALVDARRWREAGIPNLSLTINKSLRQFLGVDFDATWPDLLVEYGLPPDLLLLDVEEAVLTDPRPEIVSRLKRFADHGVRIAIDNFGNGPMSLDALQRYAISWVKLSPKITNGIDSDPERRALLEATVLFAHRLGIQVVAEGVDSAHALEAARSIGCDAIQGFEICPPLAADAYLSFLREGARPGGAIFADLLH
jgi:diguanylate cyclase (GGDEF)-like protein/PAS domain S-box-containing protein